MTIIYSQNVSYLRILWEGSQRWMIHHGSRNEKKYSWWIGQPDTHIKCLVKTKAMNILKAVLKPIKWFKKPLLNISWTIHNYFKVAPIPVQMVSDSYATQNELSPTWNKTRFNQLNLFSTKDLHFPREFELQKPGISASLSQ